MKQEHGRGVATLLSWLNASVDRERARALVDGLENTELADVLDAIAAAHLAEGNKGGVLLEAAAARLRAVDVEHDGGERAPADVEEKFCGQTVGEVGLCLKPLGHTGNHSALISTEVTQLKPMPALQSVPCGEALSVEFGDLCTLDRGHRGAHAHVTLPEVG